MIGRCGAVVASLVIGVVGFHVHVGMGAFVVAVILTLAKITRDKHAVGALPWSVIMMVCGVTVLTSLLEKTGGIDLFTTYLARFATHRSVTGLIAFFTGLVSVYSSTSGVVLPVFLPSVPGLVAKLGGGDAPVARRGPPGPPVVTDELDLPSLLRAAERAAGVGSKLATP